jgi:hypothetical protein
MQTTVLDNKVIRPRYHGDIELIAREMGVNRDTVSDALKGMRRTRLADKIREKAVSEFGAIVVE